MKKVLIFGGSGQIGRHLLRRLTNKNYLVTVVTRNLHTKGTVLRLGGNPGYVEIIEANIFNEGKLNDLFKDKDICLLYTSPSPRDISGSRMPSSA